MDAVAIADGETREAFVFFIPRGYLLPGLLLKTFKSLVEVSDGLRILLLFLVMDPVPLSDSLYERLGEAAESDRVHDVEALHDIACGCWGDRIDVGDGEIGDGHEDRRGGTG